MQETRVRSVGREDPLEKQNATHTSILAWEIPWTEEPGGTKRVRHDNSTTTAAAKGTLQRRGACIAFIERTWSERSMDLPLLVKNRERMLRFRSTQYDKRAYLETWNGMRKLPWYSLAGVNRKWRLFSHGNLCHWVPRLSDFAMPIGQLGSLFSGIRVLRFELPDDFSVPLSDCPVAAQCHEH